MHAQLFLFVGSQQSCLCLESCETPRCSHCSCLTRSAAPGFNLRWSPPERFLEENLAAHLGVPARQDAARAARSILTLLQALVHSDGYLAHQVRVSPLAQASLKPLNTQNRWSWKERILSNAGHTDQDLHFGLHKGVYWATGVNGTFTGWSLSTTLASLSSLPSVLGTVICRVFFPGVTLQPYFPSSGIRQDENFPSVDVCFMGRSFLHSMKLSIVFTIGFQQTK